MAYFSNYSARSKYYNNSNKLVVGKMIVAILCCVWKICWTKIKDVFAFVTW